MQLRLTLCTNTVASVAFIPILILTGQMSSALSSNEIVDPYFWACLMLTGVLGCMMAWISAKQINVTSPVTHHISANAKAVAQTLIAVVYFQETKTLLWWVSIAMVVIGALAYALVRMKEEADLSKKPINGNGSKASDSELECVDVQPLNAGKA
jgi:GDP-fucose transporter C1